MAMNAQMTTGPKRERPRPCTHDSTRVDGWLDDCCLHCGVGGYWKDGQRVAEVEAHPSGKPLVKVYA